MAACIWLKGLISTSTMWIFIAASSAPAQCVWDHERWAHTIRKVACVGRMMVVEGIPAFHQGGQSWLRTSSQLPDS
jgi:hypothetical protein